MKTSLIVICAYLFTCGNAVAQKINSDSLASIVEALQEQVRGNPSVFPLEAYQGGVQSIEQGLRQTYFGYGERRFSDRLDFHPAMDVAYFPTETGSVTTEHGKSEKVRAPQTYLKKVYAIQQGELVSIALISSGYKLILKHTLDKPYYDNKGKPYHHYYTCYRHLDSRSLAHLDELARKFTGKPGANHKELFGKYVFKAGEQIALVGFSPQANPSFSRAHLDFSLNMFDDPNKGSSIRNHALNPLLLFPAFEYAAPLSHDLGKGQLPAYAFFVQENGIIAPSKEKDGGFLLHIASGGRGADGEYSKTRYFALNGLDIALMNDGKRLGTYQIDRHRKLGYSTKSYDSLDWPDRSVPHLAAPLGEQEDVFRISVIVPRVWLEKNRYNWSKPGSVIVEISSIWKGYQEGHSQFVTIPIPAKD